MYLFVKTYPSAISKHSFTISTLIPSLKKISKGMPKIESENQFLMSIKGRNYVLICPAESENDALTDGRTDVQRALLTGRTF